MPFALQLLPVVMKMASSIRQWTGYSSSRETMTAAPVVPAVSTARVRHMARSNSQSEFSQLRKRRPFTVFLIMDDRSARESVAEVLKREKIDVQDYMTAMEFYRDYRDARPGVVISDLNLRGTSGRELFDKLNTEHPKLPVMLLAGHGDAPEAVKAVRDGACDFLIRPVTAEALLPAVARGYAWYYDVDWEFVGEDLDEIDDSLVRITGREREVLDLIVDGLSSREIGKKLGISTKTVEAHRARINDKMRAADLPHLVRMMLAMADQ